jgi:hypothetical protein
MTELQQRILEVQKYYYNRGNNRESVNSVYLNIINKKFAFKKIEFIPKDKEKEIIKKYDKKTGKYKNHI